MGTTQHSSGSAKAPAHCDVIQWPWLVVEGLIKSKGVTDSAFSIRVIVFCFIVLGVVMTVPAQDSRLRDQLDNVSKYELIARRTSVPSFDRTELANLTEEWSQIKGRAEEGLQRGQLVAVELALRVPALLDFALKQHPKVLSTLYAEMVEDMTSRHGPFSVQHWVGRVMKIASFALTPENARDQLLAITGRGEYGFYKRADLAEQVFARL